MKLSENFTLEELCATSSSHVNIPTQGELNSLGLLVINVLQPTRELYGKSIHINSGFRCKAVNDEKGGASNSQHLKGEAADLKCDNNALLFRLIRDNIMFDQLIWEGGDDNGPAWVHVSFVTQGNRGEMLRMKIINGKKTYIRL
jgi:zinc D-Ala-D-Ala carboxypeptidase